MQRGMKPRKLLLAFIPATALVTGTGCLSLCHHAPPPLASTTPASIAGSKRLYEKLAGTVWYHRYKGQDFEFVFGRSGFIERHLNWTRTKWRAVSPTEVILEGTTGAKMLFTFDHEVTQFTNIDWDGTPTSGKIAAP